MFPPPENRNPVVIKFSQSGNITVNDEQRNSLISANFGQ